MNKEVSNLYYWKKKYGSAKYGHVSGQVSLPLYNKNIPSFENPEDYPIVLNKVFSIETSPQPKHICMSKNSMYVSCIEGSCVDMFHVHNAHATLYKSMPLSNACVHSEIYNNKLYTTSTDFNNCILSSDKLLVTDLRKNKTHGVKTGGKWSKFIRKHPHRPLLLVSNWRSNDISLFQVRKDGNLKLVSTTPCGVSPRGIEFTPDGKRILVACYYSRNIIEIEINGERLNISHIGIPYDFPNYSGNMRDIITDQENNCAYISNMGKNQILEYDIEKKEIRRSVCVGIYPTSLISHDNLLLTTCSKTNRIYVVDKKNMKIAGVSEPSADYPVGLCLSSDGFVITTSFNENAVEFWKLNKQKIQTQS